MTAPVNPGTVALIASDILKRKVQFGELEAADFNGRHTIPGSKLTYLESTMRKACMEAWDLISAAEATRPD